MARLRIRETFFSLQGETSLAGLPTYFIRLTGCPLRCTYCDSEYAFTGGEWQSIESIVAGAKRNSTGLVCVTGGEPLAQPDCIELLKQLCDADLRVSLETSGAFLVNEVDARVIKILDLKTPGSGEVHRNRWENLDFLNEHDEIKFVLQDRADYDWARFKIQTHIRSSAKVLMSPVYGKLQPQVLADWILADKLPVRLQIQLHKMLWGDMPGV